MGYTLFANAQGGTNPADATTYYFGAFATRNITVTPDINRIYIPKTGTVTSAYIGINIAGTLGSNETSTMSFRLNNTTDTTLSSSITTTAVLNTFNVTGLSIAVSAGDYFEVKWVTPTWATNPTTIAYNIVFYIE